MSRWMAPSSVDGTVSSDLRTSSVDGSRDPRTTWSSLLSCAQDRSSGCLATTRVGSSLHRSLDASSDREPTSGAVSLHRPGDGWRRKRFTSTVSPSACLLYTSDAADD